MTDTPTPASGEQIVAHFKRFQQSDLLWPENFSQGETTFDYRVPGTTTTIQGVICCVDRDVTCSWLLLIDDPGLDFSYIATTFQRGSTQPWAWIREGDHLDACRAFITWLELNDEMPAAGEVR